VFANVLIIAFVLLSLSLVLAFVRLIRGPTLPDRVISLELLVSVTVGFIAAHSISTERAVFLDVAVVLALTAFLAAVGFARFMEQGGPRDD
jgi:multicomponent Na+:H+ antiporter subunit F